MKDREKINAQYRARYHNPESPIKANKKAYRSTEEFKKKDRERRKAYHAKQPWRVFWESACARCLPHAQYGKRGIGCYLTLDQVKTIWFQDKAYLLSRPSIDRIDTKRDYTFGNVQFIELSDNLNKPKMSYTRVVRGKTQIIKGEKYVD